MNILFPTEYWPVLAGFSSLIVWAIRLEGKVKSTSKELDLLQKLVDSVAGKHSKLEEKVIDELGRIRESLARIETTIKIKKEDE